MAYGSTQANLASTMLYMDNTWGPGSGLEGGECVYSPQASQVLSNALENMQTHTKSVSNPATVRNNPDYEQHHSVTGLILTMIGASHAHAAHAVTAEGLYRSITDMEAKPYIANDPRNIYNKSILLYQYGKLLTKWEKRESTGVEMQLQGESLLKPLYRQGPGVGMGSGSDNSSNGSNSRSNSNSNRIVFPSSILLPHIG